MGEYSNRCLNNNRRVGETFKGISLSKAKETCINRWIQKTDKLMECKHKRTSKIKKQRWNENVQKRTKECSVNCKIQRKKVKDMVRNTKKQS